MIKSIKASEIIVQSKSGSLNPEMVIGKGFSFAKFFLTGNRWTEFAIQANSIIEIGESPRFTSKELIDKARKDVVESFVPKRDGLGIPLDGMPLNNLIGQYLVAQV
jgi:hypothetical protein